MLFMSLCHHGTMQNLSFFLPAQCTYTYYIYNIPYNNVCAKKGPAYSSLNLYSKHKAGRLAFYWALWAFACWLRCCLGISIHSHLALGVCNPAPLVVGRRLGSKGRSATSASATRRLRTLQCATSRASTEARLLRLYDSCVCRQ